MGFIIVIFYSAVKVTCKYFLHSILIPGLHSFSTQVLYEFEIALRLCQLLEWPSGKGTNLGYSYGSTRCARRIEPVGGWMVFWDYHHFVICFFSLTVWALYVKHLFLLRRLPNFQPLITMGNTISSFLTRPDPTTSPKGALIHHKSETDAGSNCCWKPACTRWSRSMDGS